MEYRVVRTGQSDELEHAFSLFGKKKSSSSSGSGQQGAKKGSTWDNHKYIARQKTGEGWRYFYSQAELAAAKAKQTGQKAASAVGNAAKKGVAAVKKSVTDTKRYASNVDSAKKMYEDANKRSFKRNVSTNIEEVNARDRRDRANQRIEELHTGLANRADAKRRAERNLENTSIFSENRKRAKQKVEDENNKYNYMLDATIDAWSKGKKAQKELNEAAKNNEQAREDYEKLVEYSKNYNKNVNKAKYIAGKGLNALSTASDAVKSLGNKGKSAISKLLSDESAMAKEAWNGSIAKKAIDKGKAALDALSTRRSDENKAESSAKISPKNDRQYSGTSQKAESDESRAKKEILPKNNRQYNGTSQKAEGDETRATKDMYKNSSDEYIEALYFNSRKNDGSGVSKYLENEYNYRKAAQEANYLGRLTDSLSDDAEAALKKYGKNSDTYKRAYEKMEEAFDKLHDAEVELAKYEKNR